MDIRPQPGPQEAFHESDADLVVYGGAAGGGKSWSLVTDPLRWVHLPGFRGIISRRTAPEITGVGGLWDEASEIYPHLGGIPNKGRLRWLFPPDGIIEFAHCQYEQDLLKWHGRQADYIGLDEVTHFTQRQAFYILSRNRGRTDVKPYSRWTCNPDAGSWLAKFVSWWIGEDGYPDDSRIGKKRWFARINNRTHWAGSRRALLNALAPLYDPDDIHPLSCTFLAAKLDDNPMMLERNPGYRANLMAQRRVDYERLAKGNWKIRDDEGCEWPAEYFDRIWADDWPDAFELGVVSHDPSLGKKTGDYSAVIFCGLTGGKIWVDADIARRPVERAVRRQYEMLQRYNAEEAIVETNNFQELVGDALYTLIAREGIQSFPICEMRNKGKKEQRIRRLGAYLQHDRLRVRRNAGGELLVNQMQDFPMGDHDDGPDALEMGVRRIVNLARQYVAT